MKSLYVCFYVLSGGGSLSLLLDFVRFSWGGLFVGSDCWGHVVDAPCDGGDWAKVLFEI